MLALRVSHAALVWRKTLKSKRAPTQLSAGARQDYIIVRAGLEVEARHEGIAAIVAEGRACDPCAIEINDLTCSRDLIKQVYTLNTQLDVVSQ